MLPATEDPSLGILKGLAQPSLNPSSNVVPKLSDFKMPTMIEDAVVGVKMGDGRGKSLVADRHRLRERVAEGLVRNPIGLNPEGHYLPDDELEDLFTVEAVLSALGGNVDHTLADFVLQKARKTFATLLLVFRECESREKAMQAFRSANFTDEELSFTAFEVPSAALELCEAHPCKRNAGRCLHNFPFRNPWRLPDLKDFISKRWHFLVPTFDHSTFQYEIDSHQLLPFTTKVSLAELNHGNFSEVTCVKMLARKQTKISSSDKTIVVALKTLKRINEPRYSIDKEWRREAKAHKQLNDTRDHIIQAIAAYRQIAADRQNDTYHLVLEWADGGSLLSFWEKNEQPQVDDNIERSRERVMLVLKQFYGLVDALEGMHTTSAKSPGHSQRNSIRSSRLSPDRDVPKAATGLESPSLSVAGSPLSTFSFEGPNNLREDEEEAPGLEPLSPSVDKSSLPVFSFEEPHDSREHVGDALALQIPSLSVDGLPLPVFSFEGPNDPREDEGTPGLTISPTEYFERNASSAKNLMRWNSNFNSENWRHGDIKPENILRFTGGREDAWIGTLKLADLGRAQQHLLRTKMRETKEKEHWRTRWYEPPDLAEEVHEKAQGKISRLFDIWSVGCVFFEMALWLLYGFNSIHDFLRANGLAPNEQYATPYWRKIRDGKYEVSETASRWMNHILEDDPERHCAIGDIIKLVRERLLKVTLPPDSENYLEGFRTNAMDLKDQLAKIIAHAEADEKYLFSGSDRTNVTNPRGADSGMNQALQPGSRLLLGPKDAEDRSSSRARGQPTRIAQQRDYTNPIKDQWKTYDDGNFMRSKIGDRQLPSSKPDLCETCNKVDILSRQISFAIDTLESNAKDEECDLCELVYKVVKEMDVRNTKDIILTRSGDCFVLGGTEMRVLRLCRIDTDANQDMKDIPVGAPILSTTTHSDPSVESLDGFIKLPKEWLSECDTKHMDTCVPRHSNPQLPRRLINVENPRKPKIIEREELKIDPQKVDYIAFSHKWGKMPQDAVTTKQNIKTRTKRIPLNELPLSFKNIIAITRALGRDYLWIDSLCINQGPDGDFTEQADTMQTIFSGASCVVAACSAENATDGFLQDREPRCVKMGNVFVSSVTNDFDRDVLQSPLNRRGWVLQERALARRTIYFTNNQMYWECGDGVRCETLAKMRNDEVAFLGDPNFPGYTIGAGDTIGKQLYLFTKLFQRYSKLEFSHIEDRPIAIDGLMDRLTSAFRTQSLAGLFKSFWGRCLLWQRAEGAMPLKKIPLGTHTKRTPPSWSWMAFEGPISFLEPKGGEVDWNEKGVSLPFGNRTQSSWLKTSHLPDSNAIHALAFDLVNVENSTTEEAYLSYDGGTASHITTTKCVIIGSEKQVKDLDTRNHYIMLVWSSGLANGPVSYERVGVGRVLGKFINLGNPISILIE